MPNADVVRIRPIVAADAPALIAAHIASRALHGTWVQPPCDRTAFNAWFAPVARGRKIALVGEYAGAMVGVVNLNEIVWGPLQSAYLGYYALAGMEQRGLMTETLRLAVAHAFGPVGLHRVEANIQPGNTASRALVRRLGFVQEGFSEHYLFIDGAWRDHERWAQLSDAGRSDR